MRNENTERKTALVFLAAMLMKYLLFGFRYYPVLDDFIQYGGYPLYHDLKHVYFEIGTMATRPLASLLDPVLWGSMWGHMGIALALVTLLHFLAVYFTERCLSHCDYQMSPLFWLIVLFLPISAEGSYWISASSRLVVGLFLAAVSLYCLVRYLKEEKKLFLCLFFPLHLLSYGFYEATAIFSFLGAYFLLLKFWKRAGRKKLLAFVPVCCMFCLLVYYVAAAHIGAMGSRVSGFAVSGLFGKLWDAGYQLAWIFSKGILQALLRGTCGGLRVLKMQGVSGVLWLVAAMVLVILLFWQTKRQEGEVKKKKTAELFFCGVLLFAAPLAPNVLAETVWIPYRNILVSLFGLALMAEPIVRRIFRRGAGKGILYAVVLLICLVSWVNEYDTYRRVSEQDVRLAENIAEQLDESVLRGEKDVIVCLSEVIETAQANLYKDHVKSVFAADWSLTGAVRAVTKNVNIHRVTPVIGEAEETGSTQVLYMDAGGHVTRAE